MLIVFGVVCNRTVVAKLGSEITMLTSIVSIVLHSSIEASYI